MGFSLLGVGDDSTYKIFSRKEGSAQSLFKLDNNTNAEKEINIPITIHSKEDFEAELDIFDTDVSSTGSYISSNNNVINNLDSRKMYKLNAEGNVIIHSNDIETYLYHQKYIPCFGDFVTSKNLPADYQTWCLKGNKKTKLVFNKIPLVVDDDSQQIFNINSDNIYSNG